MEIFLHVETWVALLTLTFLEIILGIDNIIFISITAGKLPKHKVRKATNIGLFFAMIFRILLLVGVSYIIAMKEPLFTLDLSWFKAGVSGQSLVLLGGGFFLLYKSTHEIHQKVEGTTDETGKITLSKDDVGTYRDGSVIFDYRTNNFFRVNGAQLLPIGA